MIIFRYLCKEIAISLLATTLVVLIIFLTNQCVHYLNDAAAGKITLKAVVQVIGLETPVLIGYLLPLGLLLSVLIAFGRLYIDHEMVVLSACGVSPLRLFGMLLVMSVALMAMVAWLMWWATPRLEAYRTVVMREAVSTATLDKILPGRFQTFGLGETMLYAAGMQEHPHQLSDVFFIQKQASKAADASKGHGSVPEDAWDVVSAEHAYEARGEDGGRFLMFTNGYRYIGLPGSQDYRVMQFSQYGLRLSLPDFVAGQRINSIPTSELWQLKTHDLKALVEWQWRLAIPLSVPLFALLAFPLSRVEPRQGKYARMFWAVLIDLVYVNFMFVDRSWVEKGVASPTWGIWWLYWVLTALGLVLLGHQLGWHRSVMRRLRGRAR